MYKRQASGRKAVSALVLDSRRTEPPNSPEMCRRDSSDSKQVGLYFELRYDGQAVDPAGSLPGK